MDGGRDLIAICIATHRRPNGLRQLLDGLNEQTIAPLAEAQVRIIVVDNAADQSARSVVEAFRPRSRFRLDYRVEPRRGECFARNLAVATAADASHLAFIDDDEEPDRLWLNALYDAQRRTGAHMVCGAVEPIYPTAVPPELASHLQRRAQRLGQVDLDRLIMTGGAGNLLVCAEVFRRFGRAPFPGDHPFAGGTDQELMLRARLLGYGLAGAPEAIVRERVPPGRLRRRYVLARSFGSGQVHMHLLLRHRRQTWWPWVYLVRGLACVVFWSGFGLVHFWHRQRAFDAAVRVAIHAGRVTAFLRVPPLRRYRVTDGS